MKQPNPANDNKDADNEKKNADTKKLADKIGPAKKHNNDRNTSGESADSENDHADDATKGSRSDNV